MIVASDTCHVVTDSCQCLWSEEMLQQTYDTNNSTCYQTQLNSAVLFYKTKEQQTMLMPEEPTNGMYIIIEYSFGFSLSIIKSVANVPDYFNRAWLTIYMMYIYIQLAGTSKGCDIQPHSSCNGSATIAVSLSTYFVNRTYTILNNTIVDSNFVIRERFGPLITFVARLRTHRNAGSIGRYIKGIANNKQTIDLKTMIGGTMCVEQYIGDAYVLLADHDHDPEVCRKGETLTLKDGTLQKLDAFSNDTFDLQKSKECAQDVNYDATDENGILRNYPYVPSVASLTHVHQEAIENKCLCFNLMIRFEYFSFVLLRFFMYHLITL